MEVGALACLHLNKVRNAPQHTLFMEGNNHEVIQNLYGLSESSAPVDPVIGLAKALMPDGSPGAAIRVGTQNIVTIPGATTDERPKIILKRFENLAAYLKGATGLTRIKVGIRNGLRVVLAPCVVGEKGEDWLVTVDSNMASLRASNEEAVAMQLAGETKRGLQIQYAIDSGPSSGDAAFNLQQADSWLILAQDSKTKGVKPEEVKANIKEAERLYLLALTEDSLLAEAWLHLSRLYLFDGNQAQCRDTLQSLRDNLDCYPPESQSVLLAEITRVEEDAKSR